MENIDIDIRCWSGKKTHPRDSVWSKSITCGTGKNTWTSWRRKTTAPGGCAEKGISVEYIIATARTHGGRDHIKRDDCRMLRCVKMLDGPDRKLIVELYLHGKSERQISRETGVPQRTINDRKRKILSKLKKLMEK